VSILPELSAKFRAIWPHLDERTHRLMAASEAKVLGYGGVSLVSRACGLSRKAIPKGIQEIEIGVTWEGRIAQACIFGFRLVMAICGGLAIASAAIALTLIPSNNANRPNGRGDTVRGTPRSTAA